MDGREAHGGEPCGDGGGGEARAERRAPTAEERQTLRAYSGWGGLSIEGAASRFPEGFPVPEARGLIHEYYTPSKVAAEIARIVQSRLDTLPDEEGVIHALEPSAGIGRMLSAFSGSGFNELVWHAAEWSDLSGRMLHALYPELDLYQGPFERWIRERGPTWNSRLSLIVSNPPYGARGAALAEDPDREYREKRAYAYFLRRGLDLLAPTGLGVYLIPSGFLTANTVEMRSLREQVLKRHHLAAAFRLPSVKPGGREALFPGAMLVTDLLLFRARGGELSAVDAGDRGILDGHYFQEFPRHILGRELGQDAGDDDQTKKPRYGYQVEGEFSRLPRFEERPICADCRIIPLQATGGAKAPRAGVTRQIQDDTAGLPDELAAAVNLGVRVDRYLALVAAGNAEEPAQLWSELHEALRAWVSRYGNPAAHAALQKIVQRGTTGAERFVSAFTKTGTLIQGLLTAPPRPAPRYTGRLDDVAAQAELLYRRARALTVADLWSFHESSAARSTARVLRRVLAAGWCLDGESWTDLVPASAYYTGDLWPKHDRAQLRAKRGAHPTRTCPPRWSRRRRRSRRAGCWRPSRRPSSTTSTASARARAGCRST
ncbi:MAG: Eco57I restriction-modification methylase domain-containing protein [Sandaracinaceae bacterium]|nr:Eco57I restriction-modification methylase domain-containing protein [Sandaracinaceae bacterium]